MVTSGTTCVEGRSSRAGARGGKSDDPILSTVSTDDWPKACVDDI